MKSSRYNRLKKSVHTYRNPILKSIIPVVFNLSFFLLVFPEVFNVDSMGFFDTMEDFYIGYLEAPERFRIIFWGIIFTFINVVNIINVYLGYKVACKNGTR